MADLRHWNKDFITELIEYYKSYPCLWKVKSEDYKNKALKDQAYESIVEFCRENGINDANRDFVVKKIQSLRGSFRKESRKIDERKKSGKRDYKPSLWYYELLLFTKDQETDSDDEGNVGGGGGDNNETQMASSYNATVDSSTVRKKRKYLPKAPPITTKSRSETLNSPTRELSEFEAVGINMAKKMAKMDPVQAIYAESLINNVLRRGLLKKLTDDTDVCDNCCNIRRPDVSNNVTIPDRIITPQTSGYSDVSYFDVQHKCTTMSLVPTQTQVYQSHCPKNEHS